MRYAEDADVTDDDVDAYGYAYEDSCADADADADVDVCVDCGGAAIVAVSGYCRWMSWC